MDLIVLYRPVILYIEGFARVRSRLYTCRAEQSDHTLWHTRLCVGDVLSSVACYLVSRSGGIHVSCVRAFGGQPSDALVHNPLSIASLRVIGAPLSRFSGMPMGTMTNALVFHPTAR